MSCASVSSPSPTAAFRTDMVIRETDLGVAVSGVSDFDLPRIFECGQCFRWNASDNGVYTGVAFGRAARIRRRGDEILISGTAADFDGVWRDYFDLDLDYAAIRRSLCINDYMRDASEFGAGIRILRQDMWEALCSFIVSQNNNIGRIKKIIARLCEKYGEPVDSDGETYYTFPTAQALAGASVSDIFSCGTGFRAKYISDAAKRVASGETDLEYISSLSDEKSVEELTKICGVGPKVANCTLLFGFYRLASFPIDVWIRRVLDKYYKNGIDLGDLGSYAGVAQQYLFYYERYKQNGEDGK